MSQTNNVNTGGYVRVDYSRADRYVRPGAPRLSFMQKLGRGLGKVVSFGGPIAGAALAVGIPGLGLPLAAGCFGLARASQDLVYRSEVKRQASLEAYQASLPPASQINLPGLFETVPLDAGSNAVDFMAPRDLQPSIEDTIISREQAHQSEINRFNPGSPSLAPGSPNI